MPTYDYQCPKCLTVREVSHPISDITNPTKETLVQITCKCKNKSGTLMLQYFGPGIGGTIIGMRKERNLKERRVRNHKHFVTKALPGITDKDSLKHFNKKLGTKITV